MIGTCLHLQHGGVGIYTVWALATDLRVPVKAFMKVDRERVSILKNGSRTGNFSDPQSVVCSRM